MKPIKYALAPACLAVFGLASLPVQAAIITWGGGDGDYATDANWIGGTAPNTAGGDTAIINGGNVLYAAGPDLLINAGGSLVINGGSWTQTGGISWIQLSGGTLTVGGGTFNQGSAANIVRNGDSVIQVTAGTANFNGNFIHSTTSGTFTISSGGTVNVANEFKPEAQFSMVAGLLTANLISFADGVGGIDFSGGSISVNGAAAYNGFYGADLTKGLNFTAGSTGSLFISDLDLDGLTASNFLTNGTIKYDNAVDAAQFAAIETGGGVLVTVIPEPSSAALLLAGAGLAALRRRRA